MTIAVRPYLPDDLSRILDLYNSLVVGYVPHCWSVMSSSLDENAAGRSGDAILSRRNAADR